MGPVLQSATVWLAALLVLVQLTCPGNGQYMSGYGTGPFIPGMFEFFGGQQESDDPKYDDAKGASQFASFYYGQNGNNNNNGRNDQFPHPESPYKYHSPLFPSASLGTLPHPALQHGAPFGGQLGGLPFYSK